MQVVEVASLVGQEPSAEFVVRVVKAILLFDEMMKSKMSFSLTLILLITLPSKFHIPHRTLWP